MKKRKEIGAESTRILRSDATRKRSSESSAAAGDEMAAKRAKSEPAKEKSKKLGRPPKSKENAVTRVLSCTKKVSGENPERGKKKLGRPPKSSPVQKKRLGRPPKSSPILKKKLGRPPKSSITITVVANKKKKKKKKKKNKKEKNNKKKKEEAEGRATVKQKISDQIKNILLKEGWTIDRRPRNGKDYMDAVYIPPPPFKGSYWSVTKAYTMYLEQHKSSKESAGDQIPQDLLALLARQRNPDVKRRKRIEPGDESPRKKGKKKKKNDDMSKKNQRRGCALLVRRSSNKDADDNYVPYPWKRTVLSWMIDTGVVNVDTKVRYVSKKQKKGRRIEGWITREGIRCGCCSGVITPQEFEAHAGSELGRPYENIIMEEGGVSLLQCQIDAWEKQSELERVGFCTVDVGDDDPSDDTCCICGDGGDLVCCDGCPSTYHMNCLGIEMLPPGDWLCRNCSCKICGQSSDASEEGGPTVSPLISCSQCEKKFHHGCIPDADTVSVSSGSQFCGQSCKSVFKDLQKLLGIKNELEGGFSWTLIRRFDDASGPLCNFLQKAECNSKIAVALAVMEECFLSIVDQRSGIKLIHNIIYNRGSNISRLDYNGFYTFILERGDEIISVASVRIHGTKLAEMPYIGTRNMYRRQGMCRRLLNGIESALCSLNVEKLIIPSISELTETWTSVFGFNPLEISHKQEVRSINLLVFPGTGLLQKPIFDSAEQHMKADAAEQGQLESDKHDQLKVTNECLEPSSLGSTTDEVTSPS